jgi:hypothetical protein
VHAASNYISDLGFAFNFTRNIGVGPNPAWANGQIVLLLAGNLAGIAADTIPGIDKLKVMGTVFSLASRC